MTAFRHAEGAVWLRLGDAAGPDDATRVIDVWRTTVAKLLHGWAAEHYSPEERAVLDQLASDDNPWQPGGGS